MKYAFLKSKVSVIIIGLLLGLVVGFKIANSQYRREQGVTLSNAVAEAAGRMSGSRSVNSSNDQNFTPEQREQIISQVKAVIDKAKNSPQDVEAQLDAADQFIQIGRPDEALQFLTQANKVKPDDPRTTAGLGMANFMLGKYDEAIDWSKRSLAQTPKNPGATFLLVASYIRSNKNLDEAERLIKQLESDGMDPEMIKKAREELIEARSGAAGTSGTGAGAKSMLDHGPAAAGKESGGKGSNAKKTGGER